MSDNDKRFGGVSRRRYLKAAGGTGVFGAIAGCTGGGGGGGDGGDGSDGGGGDGGGGGGGGDGGDGGGGGQTTTTSQSAEDAIKVGLISPFTGAYSFSGQDEKRGVEMAFREVNNNGGVDGRKLELLTRDSKLEPSTAVRHARTLVNDEGVKTITGLTSSSVLLAMTSAAADLKTPVIASYGATDKATGEKCSKYFFRMNTNAAMNAFATGPYVSEKYGDNWAMITADYAWGYSVIEYQEKIRNEMGVSGEFNNIYMPLGTKDYSTPLNKIRSQASKYDVLVLNTFGRDAINSFNQAVNLGLKQQMGLHLFVQTVPQAGGIKPGDAEGTTGGFRFWPGIDTGNNQEWVQRYMDQYDAPPSGQAWRSYLTGIELAKVYREVGTGGEEQVNALEGWEFTNTLGDTETIRACDHQATAPVFMGEATGNSVYDGISEYEIQQKIPAEQTIRSCEETGCTF